MTINRIHEDYLDPDTHLWPDNVETNDEFRKQFADYAGPWDMYRAIYRAIECGPNIGFSFWTFDAEHKNHDTVDVWGDDLRALGDWDDIDSQGMLIMAIGASSIVEGSDAEVAPVWTDWEPWERNPEDMADDFWQSVVRVDEEACALWEEANEWGDDDV